jgi:hypothetical protein
MRSRTRTLTLPLVAVLALALLAVPARAGEDEVRGTCSGGPGEWRLKVSRESSSRLRVRFEIDHAEPSETWQLFVSDNGVRVFAGSKVADDGGSVRVRTTTADRSGRDRVKATAVNVDSGATCSGSLRY